MTTVVQQWPFYASVVPVTRYVVLVESPGTDGTSQRGRVRSGAGCRCNTAGVVGWPHIMPAL